ncbi:MoaD/ThiS family protein [Nesterenkonia ebinurensis]|uniref:MoaD/ThiS family protein n=1 Tax=Nesterenkonia ebinurensis TaxID=2608252 RepID=UPI00123D54DA|nr:MoaD/ThiS family protein [Nesterenkonia ebinurensis]
MGNQTSERETGTVAVRLYAAAAEAAGTHELTVTVEHSRLPLTQLIDGLSQRGEALERVCAQSSYLLNGTRTKADSGTVSAGDVVDILPPFAGG